MFSLKNYILSVILALLLISISNAGIDIYSYGDTLKTTINLSSGYYSKIDSAKYYIFIDPNKAVAGTYITSGNYVLKTGAGDIDSILTASWAIPSTSSDRIYYLVSLLEYNGTTFKPQSSTFKIGPMSVVMSDTLGGYGYIDENSHDGSGEDLGPIYLPGNIPADGADILVYYTGTSSLAGIGIIDAAGDFKVWLDATGIYDVEIRYPGYQSGKKSTIVPTIP